MTTPLEKTFDPQDKFSIACQEMGGIGHTCTILLLDRDRGKLVARSVNPGSPPGVRAGAGRTGAVGVSTERAPILDKILKTRRARILDSRTVIEQLGEAVESSSPAELPGHILDIGQCVLASLVAEDEVDLLDRQGEAV